MNLQLKTNHIEIIKNHAQTTYPDECCGLILGYINSKYKIAVKIIPSEWDRIYAWPEYSYVILSVQNPQASKLQSWTLDNNHQFQAETIKLIKLANLS